MGPVNDKYNVKYNQDLDTYYNGTGTLQVHYPTGTLLAFKKIKAEPKQKKKNKNKSKNRR